MKQQTNNKQIILVVQLVLVMGGCYLPAAASEWYTACRPTVRGSRTPAAGGGGGQ